MICSLTQDVVREGGSALLFRLEAGRGERTGDMAFRVISVLGPHLINGIGLIVDGTELTRLPVERCARQACPSLGRSGPELEAILVGLRAGAKLEVVFWLDARETRSVTLPLVGLPQIGIGWRTSFGLLNSGSAGVASQRKSG